jgi:cell division protein FtsQ
MGVSLLLLVSSFGHQKQNEIRVSGPQISIDYSQNEYFLKRQNVQDLVNDAYPFFDSLPFQEINIHLLEESLDNHPSIRKAEVYSGLDGILRIDVIQKHPVARVQGQESAFYLDEMGDTMALSANYSAKVPLITGLTSLTEQQKVFDFLMNNQSDSYLKDWFDGLQVEENGDWVLFPKLGHHRVLIGKPTELDKKMSKLKTFYQSMVTEENLDSLKTINLKYDGQVICRKHR